MSLPRGLVSRDGSPVKPTARLPSLRGDSLNGISRGLSASTSSISVNGTPAAPSRLLNHLNLGSGKSTGKTRGGAQKRTFKPTVPSGKTLSSQSTPDKSIESTPPAKKTRKNDTTDNKNVKNSNNRGRREEKKFVQLESSVFTGITGGSSSFRRSGGFSSSSKSSSTTISKVKAAISSPSKITKHGYLRDDFVVDSSEGEDSDGERKRSRRFKVKPIGWDTLFETNDDKVKSDAQSEKPNSPKIGAASLLKEGKPLLFQLPEQLIPRLTDHDDDDEAETKKLALEAISNRNGFLGTLRVYDSGRVEFVHDDEVNTSSRDEDAAYELIRSEEVDGTITIKQEDGSTVVIPTAITTANSQYVPRSRQEVVCLDLNQEEAISVGTVNLQEKLIMLPKILDRVDHSNL